MLRNGFWFNLKSETWEARRFPPRVLDSIVEPDALFRFRGKPTQFGSPMCDGSGTCQYREVLQYNEITDTWDLLGTLQETRMLHEVIEVPVEFCDQYVGSTQTAEEPITITDEQEEIETVAMIIGGLWDIDSEGLVGVALPEVELFGCPGSEDTSVILQDFPLPVYLLAGTYYDDKVITCGGYSCRGGIAQICGMLDDCFQWTPEEQWQPFVDNLDNPKWSHFMPKVQNLLSGSNEFVPLVIGLNSETEIYDPETEKWELYLEAPTDMVSFACFIQYGDFIYYLRENIMALDTTTWELHDLGTVPQFLENPGRCAPLEIEDRSGKYNEELYSEFLFIFWLSLSQ